MNKIHKMKNPIEVINQNIDSSLKKLGKKEVKDYLFLITELHKTDVSTDKGYQKKYKSFFDLTGQKISSAFLQKYFKLLEKYKGKKKHELYPLDIAMELYDTAGKKVQFSFATKLCHVIHPDFFVLYDGNVMGALGLEQKAQRIRKEKTCPKLLAYDKEYFYIQSAYLEILNNEELMKLIKERFFRRFNVTACEITILKMIDFILWKSRR